MRKLFAVLVFLSLASLAFAQRIDELNGKHTQLYPTKDKADKDLGEGKAKPGGGGSNLLYWGGPVIKSANVVSIFWGPSSVWGTSTNLSSLADAITNFFGQFGGTGEFKVITQYGISSNTSLSNNRWVDNSTPPTAISDSAIQNEVIQYFKGGGVIDPNAVYEVFLPPGSYSYYGSATSCGGPQLQYCAYHSNFTYGTTDIKYASMPYPSCGGCQWTGFTDAQNFEHFACHETREAVTDPDGTAWFDRRGNEADDKCAWSPAPFIGTGGYGYQWEWSNAVSGCVKTSP
jgi:hypothetical protein